MRGERNSTIALIDYLRRNDYEAYAQTFWLYRDEDGKKTEVKWEELFAATLYAFIPTGWFYLNEVTIGEMHQRWKLPMTDISKHQMFPEIVQEEDGFWTASRWRPWNFFAFMLMPLPSLTNAERKFAYAQSAVDMARIGCALERYRLAHGEYPESLAPLAPQFIEHVPHDVIGGEPLKYHRTDDGQFVLYSIGWNEKDDGGVVGYRNGSKTPDIASGDWVWRYPAK